MYTEDYYLRQLSHFKVFSFPKATTELCDLLCSFFLTITTICFVHQPNRGFRQTGLKKKVFFSHLQFLHCRVAMAPLKMLLQAPVIQTEHQLIPYLSTPQFWTGSSLKFLSIIFTKIWSQTLEILKMKMIFTYLLIFFALKRVNFRK